MATLVLELALTRVLSVWSLTAAFVRLEVEVQGLDLLFVGDDAR